MFFVSHHNFVEKNLRFLICTLHHDSIFLMHFFFPFELTRRLLGPASQFGASNRTTAKASESSAAGRAYASTTAKGAAASSAGGRASASTTASRRNGCKECCGASTCEHNRRRSRCKQSCGASICEHSRDRSKGKQCGAARPATLHHLPKAEV